MASTVNMTTSSSFYRRVLPSDTCVAFSSREGKHVFRSALSQGGCKSFFHLMEQFTTQSEPAFCGITTLLMTLNALAVDPGKQWKGPWRWYDEQMLNCCIPLQVIEKEGITLKEFACLAHCQGVQTNLHYPMLEDNIDSSSSTASLDDFRQAVRLACVEYVEGDDARNSDRLQHVLVASYSRKILGQTGDGHFSPIAAYDPTSDSVLILDVARFKYGAHWVKLPLLYDALKPIDKTTGHSRGYVMVSYLPHGDNDGLPRSVLFVSKMSQMKARKTFVDNFLRHQINTPPEETWTKLVDYYAKQHSVWEMVEPVPMVRLQDGQADDIDGVRNLIHDLRPEVERWNLNFRPAACSSPDCDTIAVAEGETMFIIYLASLTAEEREHLVRSAANGTESNDESAATARAQNQLLAEAELIALALQEAGKSNSE